MRKRRFISKLSSTIMYHVSSQRHTRYHQEKWIVRKKIIQTTKNLHLISNIHKQNNYLSTNRQNGDRVQISFNFCSYIYVVVRTEKH